MSDELVKMADQFSGLDMSALIGGPLKAACEAQMMLASSTAEFIGALRRGNNPPVLPGEGKERSDKKLGELDVSRKAVVKN